MREEEVEENPQRRAAVADYKAKTPDALQLGGGAAATGTQSGAGGGGGRGGLVEDKLQELTSKATAAKADRVRLESELEQIERVGDNVDALLAIPSIATAPVVTDRRKDVPSLNRQLPARATLQIETSKMMAARAALDEPKR
jgi:uncharacterized protein involved in exopolysaccharide biosynthesis